MLLPDKRDVVVVAGIAAVAVVGLYLIATRGKQIGKSVGHGVAETGAGIVVGIGESFSLPDTTDAVVVGQGRAALERGDLLEASQKLPALEFLNGLGSKLGISVYNLTHTDEGAKLLYGGRAPVTTQDVDPSRAGIELNDTQRVDMLGIPI